MQPGTVLLIIFRIFHLCHVNVQKELDFVAFWILDFQTKNVQPMEQMERSNDLLRSNTG